MKHVIHSRYMIALAILLLPLTAHADSVSEAAGFGSLSWYDYRDTSFNPDLSTDAAGTFNNPFVIDTPEKLAQLSWLVNVEHISYAGRVFVLGADISLDKTVGGEKVRWVPIGYSSPYPFDGMFIGREHDTQKATWNAEYDHSITGMYIDATFSEIWVYNSIGLFGFVRGFIGYLRLTGSTVNVSVTQDAKLGRSYVGLLCGQSTDQGYTDETRYKEVSGRPFHVPHGIYNVAVEGNIQVEGNNSSYSSISYCVGGITALSSGKGIAHSTADVHVLFDDPGYSDVGGICGSLESNSITDCSAHLVVEGTVGTFKPRDMGGIVATMSAGTSVSACSSSGSINVYATTSEGSRGGICGQMFQGSHITSCVSTMHIEGQYTTGGIVGEINDKSGENTGDPYVDGCVFAGDIYAPGCMVCAGGICAGIFYNSSNPDRGLYINNCIMAGTLNLEGAQSPGIIVGGLPTPAENVAGCYYDKWLVPSGNVIGGIPTHPLIRALTTEELTSGNEIKVSMLDLDESAAHGFTLTKGYYPRVFCNTEWSGYSVLNNDNNNSISSANHPYWRYSSVDKTNCVYQAGAWLASTPIEIPKGDVAYDLVSYTVAKTKEVTWTEPNGREAKIKSFPDYPTNATCITVAGDTAYATTNGTFKAVMGIKPDKKMAVAFSRPLPIRGTKILNIIATPEQEWDGSFSSTFAAGAGTAEDPYIIKTGAQLAYAVQNNQEGQFYKQLCDITLVKNLIDYSDALLDCKYNHVSLGKTNQMWGTSNEWNTTSYQWNSSAVVWRARYDGDGHLVKGVYIPTSVQQMGLFGNIESSGMVENLGVVDSYIDNMRCGLLAYKMDGTVRNCLFHGVVIGGDYNNDDCSMGYNGGICSYVGPSNSNALIEDCVSAVYNKFLVQDYSPFVSLPASGNTLQNNGKVQNCLAVVPTSFGDANFDYHYTASGRSYIQNCYWLRGYEPTRTGQTLDEICEALGKRSSWTYSKGYFPTLKTFAKKDIARLMTIPVRTDDGYDDGYDQYLLGFNRQLLFEPGSASWTYNVSGDCIEADADMGIVVPKYKNVNYVEEDDRWLGWTNLLVATLGNATLGIPVVTSGQQLTPGITIADDDARTACMNVFDTNGDDALSLDELKAVTAASMNEAFQTSSYAWIAKRTQSFPELRFFKNVTELTTQLNGFSALTEVRLPYTLTSIGSSAFDGCMSLEEVTIPARVNNIDAHPFFVSAVKNVYVDPFNENFKSRDGILFDVNDVLISYPNGRSGEEAEIPGVITEIADGAIYYIWGLKRLYFETEDYETVPYLNTDGIKTVGDELLDVYVCDATYGSVLMEAYNEDDSWADYVDADKLHCYYPLTVGSAKAATMYIGFDTELPAQLTPYIVTSTDKDGNTAYLLSQPRRVPSRTPVVIMATEAGKYRLTPLDETLEPWKMYENRLNGVGRDGMEVYQSDADRGSILTLGYNSAKTLGFYYYKGSRIAPYRAYLTYNWVGDSSAKYFIQFVEDDPSTDIEAIDTKTMETETDSPVYDLKGRKVADSINSAMLHSRLIPGIYISGGKKIIVR